MLEDRVQPAGNLTLTNAILVGANGTAATPVIGEMVYVQAQWTTSNLGAGDAYRIDFTVDGITASTATLTNGAGASSSSWYYGFTGEWFAKPGAHTVTVKIDPANTVAETNESDNVKTFSFTPASPTNFPQKLISPLPGPEGQVWGFTNYMDVNPASGVVTDYAGGSYAYDGHTGWDMSAGSFGAMDSGTAVYAAAPGTVVDVQDGNFDRNTTRGERPANYVEIDHGNGWHTLYYHLRSGSVLVKVGDTVATGQVIGLMGSSGDSSGTHLHFAVLHNGSPVETQYDPNPYWITPFPYQPNQDGVLASGVTLPNSALTADLNAEERPVSANVFTQAAGQQ